MSAEWLTAAEAATRSGRSAGRTRLAAEYGDLHGHQTKRGGRWSFRPAAVDAWVTGLDGAAACGCVRLKVTAMPPVRRSA